MDLDAAAVDEQAIGGAFFAGKCAEDPFPDAALRPSDEAVVERLLRTVDILRAIGPASATFQRMDDPAQHSAIIDTLHAANVSRQQRLDPRPLRIGKPEEIAHLTASSREAMNHNRLATEIPFMGPDPRVAVPGRPDFYYDDVGNIVGFRANEGHIPIYGNPRAGN
jgi:hypothetical protein